MKEVASIGGLLFTDARSCTKSVELLWDTFEDEAAEFRYLLTER